MNQKAYDRFKTVLRTISDDWEESQLNRVYAVDNEVLTQVEHLCICLTLA